VTLTATADSYGSVSVNSTMMAVHTPDEADAEDIFFIEDGVLKVTTAQGEAYWLDGRNVTAKTRLNGSISARFAVYAENPEDILDFVYDPNGLRVEKRVTQGNEVTNWRYILSGKNISYITRTKNSIDSLGNVVQVVDKAHISYDAQNRPAFITLNDETFAYVHNLQGDIVGILDAEGNIVVEYAYDAWGKPTAICSLTDEYAELAEFNPFRYRGYVYDSETGLYYLRTRYYNPEICRFINADGFLEGVGKLKWYTLYSYCVNNPIICIDSDGQMTEWLTSAMSNEVLYTAYWNLPLITQLKHTGFGAFGALFTIDAHQECCIKPAAEEFGVEKEMIEAVLFRELICIGLDDVAADLRFKLTGKDCSTGLGQIRASTAIAAEIALTGSCDKSTSEMWYMLQNECTNVRYVAMNLKAILNANDLVIPADEDASQYSIAYKVFARYNGTKLNSNTKSYAEAVERYYEAFKTLSVR